MRDTSIQGMGTVRNGPSNRLRDVHQLISRQAVSEIASWPERPRHAPVRQEQLMKVVRSHGVEHPITVVSRSDYLTEHPRHTNVVPRRVQYVAIADFHWLEAARALEMPFVSVVVQPMPRDSVHAYVLRRHCHDDYLGPLDEARLLRAALHAPGQTRSQNMFAEELGYSRATVSQRLSLLELTPGEQAALEAGELGLGHARRIVTDRRRSRDPKMT
ncbi:ParB/RepB/Spo0J family partition protein [Streptomyces globosus]|uniref:ParB/RepB/Spo0J family partition protein n=1 Tax=Streptomyces TaxID=1883 RepID=UPI0037FDD158